MSGPKQNHWGAWVFARSRVAGFQRNQDLAAAVGCTPHHVSRWLAMDEPPTTTRKGFDRKLASALRTDRQTLFSDYRHVAAGEAPTIDTNSGTSAEWLRDELKAMADTVDGPTLRVMLATARAMVDAGVCAA